MSLCGDRYLEVSRPARVRNRRPCSHRDDTGWRLDAGRRALIDIGIGTVRGWRVEFGIHFPLASGPMRARMAAMSETQERVLWKGCPSAALDFWLNLSCLLLLPIPWALWRWIQRRSHTIEITTERIRTSEGIFSKRVDEIGRAHV